MKQPTYTNAAGTAAAGVARLRFGRGVSAYPCPWHLGTTDAGNPVAGMNVDITESKLHFRWPGVPSS